MSWFLGVDPSMGVSKKNPFNSKTPLESSKNSEQSQTSDPGQPTKEENRTDEHRGRERQENISTRGLMRRRRKQSGRWDQEGPTEVHKIKTCFQSKAWSYKRGDKEHKKEGKPRKYIYKKTKETNQTKRNQKSLTLKRVHRLSKTKDCSKTSPSLTGRLNPT